MSAKNVDEEVKAKRKLAARMRRLADALSEGDRADLLRSANDLEGEAAKLEQQTNKGPG